MSSIRIYRSDWTRSSPSSNGTQLPDVVSDQFWSIVHNEVSLCLYIASCTMFLVICTVTNIPLLVVLTFSESVSCMPSYIFLRNLIVSDLLKSLTLAPTMLYCLIYHETLRMSNWCLIQFFTTTLTMTTSLLTVFVMALEHYVYICHDIHYLVIMTNRRIYTCIRTIWLLGFTVAATCIVLVMAGRPRFGHVTPGFVCEPSVIMKQMASSLCFNIFDKVLAVTFLLLCLFVFSVSYGRMYQEARRARQPLQQDNVRAQRTVAFYLGIFLLQLLPFAFRLVTMFHEEAQYHVVNVLLFLVPPCINPLAYGFRNLEVQQALQRLCGCRRRRPAAGETSHGLPLSLLAPQTCMD